MPQKKQYANQVELGRKAVSLLVLIAEGHIAPNRRRALAAGNLLRQLKEKDILWKVFSIPGWEVASIGGFLKRLMNDVEAAFQSA